MAAGLLQEQFAPEGQQTSKSVSLSVSFWTATTASAVEALNLPCGNL